MDAKQIWARNQDMMRLYEARQALSSPPEAAGLTPAPVVRLRDGPPLSRGRLPYMLREVSLSQLQPWVQAGYSRATWYRRQREEHGKTRWGGRRRSFR